MMLTPDQLEAAARRLCKLRGIDPDEYGRDGFRSSRPNWTVIRNEITARLQMDEALAGVEPTLKDRP